MLETKIKTILYGEIIVEILYDIWDIQKPNDVLHLVEEHNYKQLDGKSL